MKNTLTLNDLSQLLSQRFESLDKAQAENFVRIFFQNVATALQSDEHITVDGLGTFARNADSNTVSFIPEQTLADKINEPFSFFEAVELDDKYVDSEVLPEPKNTLKADPVAEHNELEPQKTTEPVNVVTENITADSVSTDSTKKEEEPAKEIAVTSLNNRTAPSPKATTVSAIEISDAYSTESEENISHANTPETEQPEVDDMYHKQHKKSQEWHLPWWIPGIAGLFIGFAIGYGINLVSIPDSEDYDYDDQDQTEEIIEQIQIPGTAEDLTTDSVIEDIPSPKVEEPELKQEPKEDKQVAQEVRTDVVKSGYYLTSMARKYYGKNDFWCYIYEENKSKLGNPNKIPAGTEVMIPPAEKYNINKDDSESLKRAAAKIAEINAKYK